MLDDFDKADAWTVFGEAEKNATYLNSVVGQLESVVSCILHHR
jgi:hypothetical protein